MLVDVGKWATGVNVCDSRAGGPWLVRRRQHSACGAQARQGYFGRAGASQRFGRSGDVGSGGRRFAA